ncbi:MAG: hypothetical protein ACHQPI_11745 [Thermoanaerobaculia bacterium]
MAGESAPRLERSSGEPLGGEPPGGGARLAKHAAPGENRNGEVRPAEIGIAGRRAEKKIDSKGHVPSRRRLGEELLRGAEIARFSAPDRRHDDPLRREPGLDETHGDALARRGREAGRPYPASLLRREPPAIPPGNEKSGLPPHFDRPSCLLQRDAARSGQLLGRKPRCEERGRAEERLLRRPSRPLHGAPRGNSAGGVEPLGGFPGGSQEPGRILAGLFCDRVPRGRCLRPAPKRQPEQGGDIPRRKMRGQWDPRLPRPRRPAPRLENAKAPEAEARVEGSSRPGVP